MKYKSQGTSLWVYLLLMFVSAASCAPKELFVAVTGVSLSQTAMSIEIGQSIQLTATISPSNASDNTVSWSSSAPAIATVSGGSVTAIAIGNALITASAGGKKDICRVTVTEKQEPVTSVALDQTVVTILAGETLQLHATVLPGHVTHAEVTWNTDNSGVAIVDTGGQVTGISEGTALITAEAGGKTAQCRITVEAAEPSAYEIWYTSTDGLALPGVSESNVNIASLRCVEGVWRIRFRYAVSEVPSWVFKNKETLKTVILPKERVLIERNTFSGCSSLEEINLSHVLSIGEEAFAGTVRLAGVTFSEDLETLGSYAFMSSGLTTVTIPAGASSGTRPFHGCPLREAYVLATTPPESHLFDAGESFPIYVPTESAEAYQRSIYWEPFAQEGRLFSMDGHQITLYKSTDYSKDGEVSVLQKATSGQGYNLVFMGDGFCDRDMGSGGKYETTMRNGMEMLFLVEPFRSLRDRFNIYMVKVVSEDIIYGESRHGPKLTYWEPDGYKKVQLKEDVVEDYASKCGERQVVSIVLTNSSVALGRSGASARFVFILNGLGVNDDYACTLVHEMGHAVGALVDEYEEGEEGTLDNRQEEMNNGSRANWDIVSDPEKVKWSRFLKDPRYSDEGLGVFLGANLSGMYRPSENSIMRDRYFCFNAPSREAIYKKVMERSESGFTYDYETFVAFDDPGRKQASDVYNNRWTTFSQPFVSLDRRTITIAVGASWQFRLLATVLPGVPIESSLRWTSSDSMVASISQDGRLLALSPGKAVVSASTAGETVQCEVTVMSPAGGSAEGFGQEDWN